MQNQPIHIAGRDANRPIVAGSAPDNQASVMQGLESGTSATPRAEQLIRGQQLGGTHHSAGVDSGRSMISTLSPGAGPATSAGVSEPLSPSIEAGVGFEMEISGVTVDPYQERGTVLLTRSGWRLETDRIFESHQSDLEIVTEPMSSVDEVNVMMNEVLDFIDNLRMKALDSEKGEVSLSDMAEDAGINCTLKVADTFFSAGLQATYGIGLDNIAAYQAKIIGKDFAAFIEYSTEKVVDFYRERFNDELSENTIGFIRIVNESIRSAEGGQPRSNGTVHINFSMMARSDFCSIFEKLLNENDQEQIKRLFLSGPNEELPPFLKALERNEHDLVFNEPYPDIEGEELKEGPTIKAWLESIIHGRTDGGILKKDWMSPPPGYPLHTGDANDYGMGAMGVDEKNELVLFEIRGSEDRKESIPMNQEMVEAVREEYLAAQECNPSLGKYNPDPQQRLIKKEYWGRLNEFGAVLQSMRSFSNDASNIRPEFTVIAQYELNLFKVIDQSHQLAGAADTIKALEEVIALSTTFPEMNAIEEREASKKKLQTTLAALENQLWAYESVPFPNNMLYTRL